MAFESLLMNKTRSFLSMLGIVIGVSTVIAVFAIGQGAQQAVDEQFEGLSAKTIIILSNRGSKSTGSSKLETEDAQTVLENATHIATATGAKQGSKTVSYGSESGSFNIVGSDLSYFAISKLELASGRLFTEEEIEKSAKVAMLGSGAIESLYQEDEDPIGTTITIDGKKLEVVGTFEEKGTSMGPMRIDDSVFSPYTTVEKSILGNDGMIILNLEADTVENIEIATEEVITILREKHKLKDSQEDDFRVMDAGSMIGAAQDSAELMTFILTSVAAIVLLVSGIGIMNVMFATVSERTKEIGIAKAIGGKQEDILNQFLLESVALSMIGGIIGVIVGNSIIYIFRDIELITLAPSLMGIIISFSFSVVVGIFFGFYPALKASRLDPVDALRSE